MMIVTLLSGGCSAGIKWHGYTFDPVHAEARRDEKLTFVYLRHWSVVACTDFEENVLKDPAVREATADYYCVPLDILWDRPLADQWRIAEPPGVVILAPDGRVLARLTGEITKDGLLAAIQTARDEYTASTQPARAP